MLVAFSGKIKAQSDLLADNAPYVPANIASLYKSDDKITISELMASQHNNTQVSVKCAVPLTVQVKVFNMDGNMAKQESHTLNKGVNELNINMDDLAAGTYMVQFYSKEGSAVRRLVKAD
jgi:methionine-rich copper-binding protein CopC